jgi:hypothetical protein
MMEEGSSDKTTAQQSGPTYSAGQGRNTNDYVKTKNSKK